MSTSARDTQAVKRLIAEVIDSFEKLEIVVHMHRHGFAATPAAEIAKALSLPAGEVDRCLQVLDRERVLEHDGPWRSAVDALVTMYDEDRIDVLNLMTRTALERVRKEAARVFADAFVLRPKKKGDPDA
jgi:hypothetical protein